MIQMQKFFSHKVKTNGFKIQKSFHSKSIKNRNYSQNKYQKLDERVTKKIKIFEKKIKGELLEKNENINNIYQNTINYSKEVKIYFRN